MNLSLFFPAYNEEANIETVVRGALEVAGGLEEVKNFEVIIVDDGSSDKTSEIADQLASEISRVRVIHHQTNRGYGGALKSGFYSARYNWICFTDADGQFDFSEVAKFLPLTSKVDLILGYRLKRADSFLRKANAYLWSFLMRIFFGLKVKDLDCGFKVIKKEVIENIPKLESEGAFLTTELLVKAKRAGFRFAEVGVHHHPRLAGQQTGANIKVILKAFQDLFSLWRKL